jgi:aminopeptidase YwaD
MNQNELLETIIKERPVASMANERVLDMIQTEAIQMGWNVISKSFVCTKWEKGRSSIEIGKHSHEIFPSPFSKAYKGNGDTIVIHSLEELESFNITEKIVFLKDNIAKEPMQPKNFPFYYPDEHKHVIDLLEEKKPRAIIAVTGKHEMCGLNPFPMFEDGNFSIPSAYINELTANNILTENGAVNLNIVSNNSSEKSRQIIVTRKAKGRAAGKIIICAHMDTKYGTPGAIDNAAGVVVLLKIMEKLKNYTNLYDIDIMPLMVKNTMK